MQEYRACEPSDEFRATGAFILPHSQVRLVSSDAWGGTANLVPGSRTATTLERGIILRRLNLDMMGERDREDAASETEVCGGREAKRQQEEQAASIPLQKVRRGGRPHLSTGREKRRWHAFKVLQRARLSWRSGRFGRALLPDLGGSAVPSFAGLTSHAFK